MLTFTLNILALSSQRVSSVVLFDYLSYFAHHFPLIYKHVAQTYIYSYNLYLHKIHPALNLVACSLILTPHLLVPFLFHTYSTVYILGHDMFTTPCTHQVRYTPSTLKLPTMFYCDSSGCENKVPQQLTD